MSLEQAEIILDGEEKKALPEFREVDAQMGTGRETAGDGTSRRALDGEGYLLNVDPSCP